MDCLKRVQHECCLSWVSYIKGLSFTIRDEKQMNMDSDFSLHLGKLVVECRWGLSPDSNSEYLFWCRVLHLCNEF